MAKAKTIKKMAVKETEALSEDENSDFGESDGTDIENDDSGLNSDDNEDIDDGYDDDSEDNIQETLVDTEGSLKRKQDEQDAGPAKKRSRKKNVKPPTAEEMLALRETENLFQSNLFRLQIDEMLSELKPKKSVKKHIGSWIENLKTVLLNSSESEAYDLSNVDWLKQLNIQLPLRYKVTEKDKGLFQFKAPVEIIPIGTHSLGCPLGPFYSIDLAVVMPKVFVQSNDNLNLRYHLKRALYLCYIAQILKTNCDLISPEHNLQFTYMSGDTRKPLLVLRPSGKLSKFITVHLYPIPKENSFKMKRLLPSKNNTRPDWWGLEKDFLPPTPIYNSSILEDIVLKQNHLLKKEIFDQNKNLRNASVLLRVWLKQRGLTEGIGGFNSHLLCMLLIYLLKTSKINKHMSSYQIIRHVWLYLGDSDWTENGPRLCEVKQEEAPSVEEFHIYFDIVFVDVSGFYNIAANLNKLIYLCVKHESKLAVQHLDNHEINGFRALFMVKMPFVRQFDAVISFPDFKALADVAKSKGDKVNLMDHTTNVIPEFLRLVTDLLDKGVGHRVTNIGVKIPTEGSWDIDAQIPPYSELNLGLNLNSSTALSLIDKGPQANDPSAEEFREFWGKKCELRRFKDGSVCESVVWEKDNSSVEKRRTITNDIILYLLKVKLEFKGYFNLISKSFQKLVLPEMIKKGLISCEETCKSILLAYEDLSRQLRDLPDLPLSIVSVHCISPSYRFTEPFPPVKPYYHKNISPLVDDPVRGRLFSDELFSANRSPEYIAPVDCVIQMELTKKWPNNVNAGKRLIAAFNLAISAALKTHCNLSCQVTTDYIVVNKDGYLFRLYLGYSKEIGLLKLKISEEGVRHYRDTSESLALEKKFFNLPKITGAIYRLSEEYPGFSSATCLVKRWFSSQLFDETHFPGVLIEMIMAYLFINPQPFTPCIGLLPAFLRFLAFISTTDWSSTPLIVNFNSLLTKDELKEIEDAFRNERTSFPPLFLATPYDKSGSLWSKTVPTLSTLVRLAKLSAASLQIIEKNITNWSNYVHIKKVFQPPMSVYDAVITLNEQFQLRKEESFFNNDVKKFLTHCSDRKPILPILGFNPIDLYLAELRESYGSFALFFHDTYGGLQIGVLFKPNFLENIPFQSSLIVGRKPVKDNSNVVLKPHIDSVFEGFKILGNGIVSSIELKKLKIKMENH